MTALRSISLALCWGLVFSAGFPFLSSMAAEDVPMSKSPPPASTPAAGSNASGEAGFDPAGPIAVTPAGSRQTVEDLHKLVRGKERSPEELAKVAAELEETWKGTTPPEHIRMIISIAKGGQMGGESGWFGPAKSRYSWAWLAKQQGIAEDGELTEKNFRGPAELFAGLDRNGNGRITQDDFDWSDDHPDVERAALIHRFFRKMDGQGDGRLTREDLLAFFDKAAGGKDHLKSGDLRRALLAGYNSYLPGDAPTPVSLLGGLFTNELGSLYEGPALDAPAPDFALQTQDRKQTVRLSEQIGKRPVVLMFGNFTCAPFRSHLPVVEELHERYKDRATFLGVYVREAHPTDGWLMESNTRAGVKFLQPKTYDEREAVATACHVRLHYEMPLLVDKLDDRVGNAYSGMPARLYVIDSKGRVAYKAGRGPFGLKPAEMEQALVMLLLDEAGGG